MQSESPYYKLAIDGGGGGVSAVQMTLLYRNVIVQGLIKIWTGFM